jgi:hypothetical protein
MMPSSYYLYTVFYRYFWIANFIQILVYFISINLTSNGSLFKWVLPLLLLTLTSLSALQRVVVVCVIAHHLGGCVAVCIVVHHLRCCPSSASCQVVVSPCCLHCGTSSLFALLPVVLVAPLSCASSSVVCIVIHCLRRCPLSALRWRYVTGSTLVLI